MLTFEINGQSVTPSEDQSFAHNVSSMHGVNLLVAEAEDGAGGRTRTVRSYSHSSRWYPPTSTTESWAGKAIEIFLPRSFVDDGDRNMAKPNDLATIITMYLATLDIGSLIPNPVYDANNYKVYLKNVTVQTPEVSLLPQGGYLYLEAWFKNLRGKVDAIGSCYVLGVDLCPDAKGDLEVDSIHLEARIALSVDSNNEVKAEVTHLVLALRNPSVKLQGLGVLLNPIVGALIRAFEEDAEAMLKQELAQVLPDLFTELFGQLALDEGIAIPSLIPGGPESLVQLQTRMAALDVTHKGIGLAMDARVRTQKKVTHNPLGSIGRGGCYGTDFGEFVLQQLEMQTAAGIHDDLLNQLLFAMWYGGSLNVTLAEAELGAVLGDLAGYGVQQPVIRLDFFSSPMFTACGTGDELRFGIGDLYVEMDMLFLSVPVTIALYASVLGTGELSWLADGAGGSIGIQLTSIDALDYEFVSATEGYEVLIDLFDELMQGDLLTGALDSLLGLGIQGFELPEIDLSGLLPGVPQGTKLKIVPASLQRRTGYTELLGTIDL